MNKIVMMSVLILMLSACSDGQKINFGKKNKSQADSLINPKTHIKVNKEYDKNGNLIRYDSSYTSISSNIGNEAQADSIFRQFKSEFNQRYPFSTKPYFNDLFFNDSLLFYDFYKKDFFEKRFELNRKNMENMFKEMDSIKNEYYKKLDSL